MAHFRRFRTIQFGGSAGPSPLTANRYCIAVSDMKSGTCYAEFSAKSLPDAFKLIRLLMVKHPARLVSVSRVSYSGSWVKPIYKPISGTPDYPESRPFSKWEKRGKVWIERANPVTDILAALS